MSAERPLPNPEVFGQQLVRREFTEQLLRAQAFYRCPLVTQAALTINLALGHPPLQGAQNIDEKGTDFRYETDGIKIARSIIHNSKLVDLATVTFPPEAFGDEQSSNRYLTVSFTKSVNLSQVGIKKRNRDIFKTHIMGVERVTTPQHPDLTRSLSGRINQEQATIDRTIQEVHEGYRDTIILVSSTLPTFDAGFFDTMFTIVPPAK